MSTEISVRDDAPPQPQPSDVRRMMMHLPVDQMIVAQQEYLDRRNAFRDWLKTLLIEGVHYGYPPYCEPKLNDKGEVGVWAKGGMRYFPKEQWQARPSLYKAGAQFICDIMNVVAEFSPDIEAWKQAGGVHGMFVIKCRLFPRGAERTPENLVGEGMGLRCVGDKGGDGNNAIKMAEKNSLVDAVLNAYGLSDLFTQDIEDQQDRRPDDGVSHPQERPEPRVQPRAKRDRAVATDREDETVQKFDALKSRFKAAWGSEATPAAWSRLVVEADQEIDPTCTMRPAAWKQSTFDAVNAAITAKEKIG